MLYLIWSHEHRAWWRPDGAGYTPNIDEAGEYQWRDAADIVLDALPPGREVAVEVGIGRRRYRNGLTRAQGGEQ